MGLNGQEVYIVAGHQDDILDLTAVSVEIQANLERKL
jgi:hypothetical protein